MIDLRADNVKDAYYWRAYNHHVRQDLAEARADIESAKRMGLNPMIETLAGIIEHDQDDLSIAQHDLEGALSCPKAARTARRCGASVSCAKRQEWMTGEAIRTRNGLLSSARPARHRLRHEARTELDPEFRTRQIEGFKAAIKEDTTQYHGGVQRGELRDAGSIPLAGNRPRSPPETKTSPRK